MAASISCTNLTSDLSRGMIDSYANGSVFTLQNFLSAQGYLKATPNGSFGPATFSSVIAFQVANNISSTGFVGPITRAAIRSISCSSSVNNTNTTQTSVVTPSLPVTPTVSITEPTTGANLSIGQKYTISWNGSGQAGYSIVLEDQNGVSQGFIQPNMVTSGSYVWQVGQVLSGATNLYSTVGAGLYKIHIYNVSGGMSDVWSGVFNIVAPPLTLQNIIPSTISLKSTNSAIALYGSGLNTSIQISIDGYYNLSGNASYVSPDGSVAVFLIPSGITTGLHNVVVSNNYGSVATEPITITQ